MKIEAGSPYTMLFPFQKRWLADKSRFKIWLASRQIGKSFDAAAEINEDCFLTPNTLWVVLSASEDQSKEFIEKVEVWANLFKASIEFNYQQPWEHDPEIKVSSITYANGSRVIGLPANPRTARGYSGNVVLDEFAHHADSEKIWAAIYPTISNPLKGNLKLRILSTPNGKRNKFAQLWHGENDFSKHSTTILEAVAEGFPADIDELRKNAGDELTWRQEYLCEFLDELDGQNLIKGEWVERAMRNDIVHIPGARVTGCDFAYTETGDENTMAIGDGNKVEFLEHFRGKPIEIVDFFVRRFTFYKLKPQQIVGDGDGGGQFVMGMLADRGWEIVGINSNARAFDPDKFANKSAEMWYHVARLLERGEVMLPKDAVLFEQLTERKMVFDEKGKLKLESKKKLNKSPDRADAVVLALYPHQLQPVSWIKTGHEQEKISRWNSGGQFQEAGKSSGLSASVRY